MEADKNDYRSYLLRLWRVRDQDESRVRASLEDVMTSEVCNFTSLEALVGYLEKAFESAKNKSIRFEVKKR
jgi:hypothetical protein